MSRAILLSVVLLLVGLLTVPASCERSQPSSRAPTVPSDLKEAVDNLVQAFESFDVPRVLDAYADDFTSGTGRSKEGVSEVLAQLRAIRVSLKVESAQVEEAEPLEARLKTRFRLRYTDRFRNLGEGEVVITDILVHSLRKEANGWKIYTDERVATYREGRFGSQSPNVQVEVPEKLPTNLNYPVTVSVQRQKDMVYQVMLGNYVEDPVILPPPDIVTMLPNDGVLRANLLPNPQGRSEMVRVTVIAQSPAGQWLGATTVSKLVPGAQQKKRAAQQETT